MRALKNLYYQITFINKFRLIPSDITSLNHKDIQYITLIRAKSNRFTPFKNPWKDNTAPNVVANKQRLVFRGQGEGETKWKGWAWNWLRTKLDILFNCLKLH